MKSPVDTSPSLAALLGLVLGVTVFTAVVTTGAFIVMDRFDRATIELSRVELPTIVVQVDGAVATPGVYTFPAGARLNDAVEAAGGLRDDADSSTINLAARVGDGEAVTIDAASAATPMPDPGNMEPAGLININTATIEELETLPGIGPVLGERIVDYREEHGPFATVDALTDIDGISDTLLEDIRPHVTVDD